MGRRWRTDKGAGVETDVLVEDLFWPKLGALPWSNHGSPIGRETAHPWT